MLPFYAGCSDEEGEYLEAVEDTLLADGDVLDISGIARYRGVTLRRTRRWRRRHRSSRRPPEESGKG